MKSKKILGVKVDFGLNMNEVLGLIENVFLKDEKVHILSTTNPEFIIDAQNDNDFKEIINDSSLSVPDGIGVVIANKYLEKIEKYKRNFLFPFRAFMTGCWIGLKSVINGNEIKNEKITGVDLTYKICELASKKGYSVFFLGGRAKNVVGRYNKLIDIDVSDMAANEMRKLYPGVNIIGSTSKFNRDENDDEATLSYIHNCMDSHNIKNIDFLFVAYNHIYQEKWIKRNSSKIYAKISIGCGGTFDYIAGQYKLPPEKYVKKNLGWLYRLYKQPWRIKRIIKAFPIFPVKLYLDSLRK